MPDLSEFHALSEPCHQKCGVAAVLEQLKPKERELLDAALAANGITHVAISKWLHARGKSVSDQTVSRHRKRRCSCPI